MKIVLAADGSKYTRRAVKYLITHLEDFGSRPEIHLLHVQPPVPGRAAAAISITVLRRYYQDESRRALFPALSSAPWCAECSPAVPCRC